MMEVAVGKTYEVACPFIRQAYTDLDEDGQSTTLSWKPGIVWEPCGPEDVCPRAHGLGAVFYRVISICDLPRPYPSRVFFTRRWRTPDGREFGKRSLHCMVMPAFRRRLTSYLPAGVERHSEFCVRDVDQDERELILRRAA